MANGKVLTGEPSPTQRVVIAGSSCVPSAITSHILYTSVLPKIIFVSVRVIRGSFWSAVETLIQSSYIGPSHQAQFGGQAPRAFTTVARNHSPVDLCGHRTAKSAAAITGANGDPDAVTHALTISNTDASATADGKN